MPKQGEVFCLARVMLVGCLTTRRCKSIRSRLGRGWCVIPQTILSLGDTPGSVFFIEQDPASGNSLTLDQFEEALHRVLRHPFYRYNGVTAYVEVLEVTESREISGEPDTSEADAAIANGEVSGPFKTAERAVAALREAAAGKELGAPGAFAAEGVLEEPSGGAKPLHTGDNSDEPDDDITGGGAE